MIYFVGFVLFFILVLIVGFSQFDVRKNSVAIVETFGSYSRTKGFGRHWLVPLIEKVVGEVSLAKQEQSLIVSYKDLSANSVRYYEVKVFYRIDADLAHMAYYQLGTLNDQLGEISQAAADWVSELVPVPSESLVAVEISDYAMGTMQDRLGDKGFEFEEIVIVEASL